MPRTPRSEWGNLFNFAGGGLVHVELFALLLVSADNPTLFEAISNYLLMYGTHANRPSAANVALNSIYFETDTGNLFQNQAGTWTQIAISSGSGGSGALQFVDEVVLASPADVLSFTGLDGDTDNTYKLVFSLLWAASARADLQINGAATNLSFAQAYNGGGASATPGIMVDTIASGDSLSGFLILPATSAHGLRRAATGTFCETYSGTPFVISSAIQWSDTSSNITALSIQGNASNCFDTGSYAQLYKLGT